MSAAAVCRQSWWINLNWFLSQELSPYITIRKPWGTHLQLTFGSGTKNKPRLGGHLELLPSLYFLTCSMIGEKPLPASLPGVYSVWRRALPGKGVNVCPERLRAFCVDRFHVVLGRLWGGRPEVGTPACLLSLGSFTLHSGIHKENPA